MPRFIIEIRNNRVVRVTEAGSSEDEDLGIEWALSELRDSYRHDGRIDGLYTVADASERDEFLEAVAGLMGEAEGGTGRPPAEQG
jgi:hypothetical protein